MSVRTGNINFHANYERSATSPSVWSYEHFCRSAIVGLVCLFVSDDHVRTKWSKSNELMVQRTEDPNW